MMLCMRTTISIDDRLGQQLKQRAASEGISVSALVSRALTELLTRNEKPPKPPAFQLITVGGNPRPGIDLDRTSALLAAEDVEKYARKEP